jgi:hypothetical protein
MTVSVQEAIAVQEAARMINDQISAFKEIYANQDDLNIAIMCCLKIATDSVKQGSNSGHSEKKALDALAALEKQLDDVLEQS